MSDSEFEDRADINDIADYITNELNRLGIKNTIQEEQVFSNFDNL